MRTHGSARRSRAIWSPRRVSSFSRARSFLRSAIHCCRDTTGWSRGGRVRGTGRVADIGGGGGHGVLLDAVRDRLSRDAFGAGCPNGGSYKCGGIPMDSLITAAARALAAGDPLGALNRVALRDDAPALALRGIAMAQLGDFARAKTLLRAGGARLRRRRRRWRAPAASSPRPRSRWSRATSAGRREALDAARATLEQQGDRLNAAHARPSRGAPPAADRPSRRGRARAGRARPGAAPAGVAGGARAGGRGHRDAPAARRSGARGARRARHAPRAGRHSGADGGGRERHPPARHAGGAR